MSSRQVTRGLVWLPPYPRWRPETTEVRRGSFVLTRRTRQLIGRVGWIVVTEQSTAETAAP